MLYEQKEVENSRRQAQRRALLEHAADILSQEGRSKLSLRNVASACDMSTQMVYTLFGGKSCLLQALHREGFRRMGGRLDDHIARLDPSDAFEHLACTFRDFALDDPNLYSAMFGPRSQGFRPKEAGCERRTQAYAALEKIIDSLAERGDLHADCTRRVTDTLWAFVHGTIAMELAGYHQDLDLAEENFIFACQAALNGVLHEDDPLEAA